MSTWKAILDYIGINGPNTVAGFGGGLVNVFWSHKLAPYDVVGALIAGSLTANYLGPPIAELAHFPLGGTCFVVGLAGLHMVSPVIALFRRKVFGDDSITKQPPGVS